MRPLLTHDAAGARFVVGMFWGLVPCALVYGVLPVALFAGGPVEGAAVMLAFGLGTLPNLVAGGLADGARAALVRRLAACATPPLRCSPRSRRSASGARSRRPATLAQGPFCLMP